MTTRIREQRRRAREPEGRVPWHAVSASVALDRCQTRPGGLSEAEARERLAAGGPNRFAPSGARTALGRRLRSVPTLVLTAAAGAAWFAGARAEAGAVLAVLVADLLFRSILALRTRSASGHAQPREVSVVREGTVRRIRSEQLVPGDLVELREGERVPADLRLLESTGVRVDESLLTGHGSAVPKAADPIPAPEAGLAGRSSMLHAGSSMIAGRATAVVVATGPDTEWAKIRSSGGAGSAVGSVPRELDRIESGLVGIAVALGGAVALASALRGADPLGWLELFVALAVAAVPAALPALTVVALVVGVRRMARGNAVLRRPEAIRPLAGITVACIDKTGILTAGEMTAARIITAHRDLHLGSRTLPAHNRIAGSSEPPVGEDDPVSGELALIYRAAALTPRPRRQAGVVRWDAADAALLALAGDAGLEPDTLLERAPQVAELPFTAEAGASVSFHREGRVVRGYVKGAPAVVLRRSRRIWGPQGPEPLTPAGRDRLEAGNRAMAEEGLRVIALGLAPDPSTPTALPEDLVLLGLVGLRNPPAEGAAETIQSLQGAGIRPVLLTGDQTPTARAMARAVGIPAPAGGVLAGWELEEVDDDTLARMVGRASVFSRVGPEAKGRIVRALRSAGETVAMVGDGVNDAGALEEADVSLVMGLQGTEGARDRADVILGDDRLATAAVAVEEARITVDNLSRVLTYLLTCSVAEILVLTATGASGLPLPLPPSQIVWLNLVGVLFPALALASSPGEPLVMWHAAPGREAGLRSRASAGRIGFFGLLIAGVTVAAYLLAFGSAPLAGTLTVAFATLATAQLLQLWNDRARHLGVPGGERHAGRRLLYAVPPTVALQLLALYWPPLSRLLGTVPPGAAEWTVILPLAAVPVVAGRLLQGWDPDRPWS